MQFKDLTTFKIGGPIKHFFEVEGDEELIKAAKFTKDNKLKMFILGGGSDILVDDKGFDGAVIKYIKSDIQIDDDVVTADAACSWDRLVEISVEKGLQGLECMSGIPGTVGASPIQNIGAYGQEVKDTFLSLRAFDFEKEKFVEFSNKDCDFSYRESFFKKPGNWQKYLITSVSFKLKKDNCPKVEYKSLKEYLDKKKIKDPCLKDVREAVLNLRKEKLENPKEVGNAGSFFKNPIVEGNKISAGELIDKAGWKGKTHKGAGVSAKNALILINKTGKASFNDVVELSDKIIKDVKEKFGVTLEPEVQFITSDSSKSAKKGVKKVAILGYGLEGMDAEKYFKSLGCEVSILDRKFDENYLQKLESFDLIIRSPGVYRYLPELIQAEKNGVEITSALKIFLNNCPAKIIGVTGTKGKGTTSTLIYEILKDAGKDVYLVGNIGRPYLELLSKLKKESYVVMELSSFQLIDVAKSPHISVLLNITLDHMDWHKDKEEYVDSKKNIVRFQTKKDYAVINSEYEASKNFSFLTKAKVVFFGKKDLKQIYKENLLLKGEHNLENIAAAVTVSEVLKIDEKVILNTVRNFKGLEHRLELVEEINGISFYNDSFATGPQPTIAAIKSFREPVTLILGGSDKGLSYKELGEEIVKNSHVKKIITIGKVASSIIKSLNDAKYRGAIINLRTKPMWRAVNNAFRNTPSGGVVLLSPAAASFDMFRDYKDRGNQFKEAVRKLK